MFLKKKQEALGKKNSSFIAGLWGQKILEAEKNPEALFVMVAVDLRPDAPGAEILTRFRKFAKKRLGKRFLECKNLVMEREFNEELRKRSFFVDPHVFSGKAFGEWWGECIQQESKRLAKAIGVKRRAILGVSGLSVSSPWKYSRRKEGLGTMRQDIRNLSAKNRRKKARRK